MQYNIHQHFIEVVFIVSIYTTAHASWFVMASLR